MKFINQSNNTIYVSDIDRYIPFYEDNSVQEISCNDFLKSEYIQKLILQEKLKVIEWDNNRLQNNLKSFLDKKIKDNTKETESILSGKDLELKIRGVFHDLSGYAKSNRNLFGALASQKMKIQILPLNAENHLNEIENKLMSSFFKPLGDKSILLDSFVPTFSSDLPKEKCSYRIINTTIESHTIPKQFIDICNNEYDEVWVVSDFCKEVFLKGGLQKPIFVFPNIVNVRLYQQKVLPYEFYPKLNNFVFLSIFNWHYRKGYDALIKSYCKYFNKKDDVTLLLLIHGKSLDKIKEEIKVNLGNLDNFPHIVFCDRYIPEHQMPRVYSACNCFILPSRGEGFGLPFAEAGVVGKPVIASNVSGHTMFLNQSNSILVPIDKLTIPPSGSMKIHFWEGQQFADLTSQDFIDNLGKSMKFAYENNLQNMANKLKEDVIQKFSPNIVGKNVKERLERIWQNVNSG